MKLMSSNICIILWILQSVLETCISKEIVSHLEHNIVENKIPKIVLKEIEKIYIDNINTNEELYDSVCNLTDDQKTTLCNIVFGTKYYKYYIRYYTNKIFHYMAKLPCRLHRINFRYLNENEIINQPVVRKLYPCYGKHHITRTSFIEDTYSRMFYISAGPFPHSITVYVSSFENNTNYYYINNYVYNVDLSELSYTSVSIKEVTEELKEMKKMFSMAYEREAELNYKLNIYYFSNEDPLCNLEYEKKITLCNIIFDHYGLTGITNILLNKSASYILSMACVKKSVYKNITITNEKLLLRAEQEMYPCYGNNYESQNPMINLLSDLNCSAFYLSSGTGRNTIYIYFRKIDESYQETFTVLDLFGNINVKNLRPTIITIEDLIAESAPAYFQMQRIINRTGEHFKKELTSIASSSQTDQQENEQIEQLIKRLTLGKLQAEESYTPEKLLNKNQIARITNNLQSKSATELLSEDVSNSSTNTTTTNKNNNNKNTNEERKENPSGTMSNEMLLPLGSQVLKRLVLTLKSKWKNSAAEIHLSYYADENNKKKNKNKIQKFIAEMEGSLIISTEKNFATQQTSKRDKQLLTKKKKKKSGKK